MSSRDAEIEDFYTSGIYTLAEVGEIYGVSRQRVLQILQSRGVPTDTQRKRSARIDQAVSEVVEAIEGGKILEVTLAEIAQRWGTTSSTLGRKLAEKGYSVSQARAEALAEMHQRRLAGEGRTRCSRCNEVKPWEEMRRRGQTRSRLCYECLRRINKVYYRRRRKAQ